MYMYMYMYIQCISTCTCNMHGHGSDCTRSINGRLSYLTLASLLLPSFSPLMCRAEPTGDRSPRPLCTRWAELTGDSLRPLLVVAALRKVGAGEVDLLRSMF